MLSIDVCGISRQFEQRGGRTDKALIIFRNEVTVMTEESLMLIFTGILTIRMAIMAIHTLVMITMITIILMMLIQHRFISPLESSSQYCYTYPYDFWVGLCLDNLRHMNSYLSLCLPFLMSFSQCCGFLSVSLFFFFIYYCLIFGEVKMKLIRKFQNTTISENSRFSKITWSNQKFVHFSLFN